MKHFLFFTAAIGGLFTLVHAACGSPFVLSSVVTNNLTDFFITIGDVNGDGKPDAVGLSQFGNTVTVATNAGNGIFFSNATYAVGSGPRAGAIADINGDGKPDLITANFSDNTVTVLTNAGGGIFVSNAACAVGNGPEFVLVTDINGDGKPDIITINNGDGTLTILTNAGGTFPVAQKVQVVNSNSAPMTFAVADINGDGKPDIIAGDVNDGLIEVLTNAGAGIFVSNAVYAAGSSGNGPEGVEAADFNKDGKMDVAAINKDGTVTVLTNAGNSVLVSSQTITLFSTPIIGRSGFAATADVDGDGYPDLLLDEIDGFTLTLFNSGSGGTFITNYLILTNTAINMGSFGIAAGDL
ncbi:MAG TPA: VCBS repeat-containing protein, partial [Candidatus Acidoferrum sp.]|nr:VCBS repeat-containing protein [Candidatus Acidoferrum sp.]